MKYELNKIYNMDCLEFMRDVPDNYFDLVLTDPPYGINIAKKGSAGGGSYRGKAKDFGAKEWDNKTPSQEVFNEIIRISKNQIIFGGNYFIEYLKNTSCMIFWDKDNGDNNFADGEIAWASFKTAVRVYKYRWNGMLQQDMMNKEERFHPTQKPAELFKDLIRDYGIKNGYKTVFDPFMGSGTTAVACKSLGIDFVGCELEADYVAIANKRLEAVQGSLF